MKTLFFILLLSIPCLGNATALSPASVGTNAPAVFHSSLEAKPSETGTHHNIQAMRPFIFMLLISLPCTAGATIAAPIPQGETVITQQAIPHGFAPKKQRFFERFAEKILQKRIKKALGRSDGEAAKLLSILGFVCSVMGIIFLFAGAAAGLVLLSAGLILSIIGLALSSSATKKWVKGMAIAGIVLPVVVGLLILAWLGSGY